MDCVRSPVTIHWDSPSKIAVSCRNGTAINNNYRLEPRNRTTGRRANKSMSVGLRRFGRYCDAETDLLATTRPRAESRGFRVITNTGCPFPPTARCRRSNSTTRIRKIASIGLLYIKKIKKRKIVFYLPSLKIKMQSVAGVRYATCRTRSC